VTVLQQESTRQLMHGTLYYYMAAFIKTYRSVVNTCYSRYSVTLLQTNGLLLLHFCYILLHNPNILCSKGLKHPGLSIIASRV